MCIYWLKNVGEMLVKEFEIQTKTRMRFIYLVLIGFMSIILLRIGYMQFIYQQNIVTFAQIDQTVAELNVPILEEVKKRFDVNLDGYQQVLTDDIINSGKTDIASLSLLDIVYTSCKDGCYGRPSVYLHSEQGYVFFKNNEGKNTLLELKRNQDRWEITETIEKTGE